MKYTSSFRFNKIKHWFFKRIQTALRKWGLCSGGDWSSSTWEQSLQARQQDRASLCCCRGSWRQFPSLGLILGGTWPVKLRNKICWTKTPPNWKKSIYVISGRESQLGLACVLVLYNYIFIILYNKYLLFIGKSYAGNEVGYEWNLRW